MHGATGAAHDRERDAERQRRNGTRHDSRQRSALSLLSHPHLNLFSKPDVPTWYVSSAVFLTALRGMKTYAQFAERASVI